MSIIRAPRPDSRFYTLDKRISEDARLSWAARGLLIFLLGKPDNWNISIEHLKRQTEASRIKTRRDGIYALLDELQSTGYVTRRAQQRDASGRLAEADYIVSEDPNTAGPHTAEPCPAEPYTADTTLTSNHGNKEREEQGLNKSTRFRAEDVELPPCVPREAWLRWCKHRRQKRQALTELSVEGQLKFLVERFAAGEKPADIIDQSIQNTWTGLFELKRQNHTNLQDRRRADAREAGRQFVEEIQNGDLWGSHAHEV